MHLLITRFIYTTAISTIAIHYQLIRCGVLKKSLISVTERRDALLQMRLLIQDMLLPRGPAMIPLSEKIW